ncbi:MAG: hypothetical protein ACI9C9_002878 [Marivirga sp.]|jgi:hypothetical protein
MIFEVQKQWEVEDKFGILDPNTRQFPLFKLGLNIGIFLVDIEITHKDEDGEEYTMQERFFLGTVFDTLEFLSSNDVNSAKISYLSRRCDNEGSYATSDVIKIFSARDSADQLSHIVECKDNRSHVFSPLTSSVEELTNKEIVYFDSVSDHC